MSPLSVWEDLKKQVLLGTARQPEPIALPEGLPSAQGSAEMQALFALSALGTYLRVATEPQKAPAVQGTPALPEVLPECSPAASSILQTVQATSVLILPEALVLLQKRGWRVPHALIPSLLEAATADSDLRPAVLAVMGQRGNWLARQNPRWKWAVQLQEDTFQWEEGLPQERRQFLEKLRLTDPAQALDVLASSWKQEKAADRESFLQALNVGLSGADEAFLEQALLDRSKGVREKAAELLAQLPESAYQKRMQERGKQLLVRKPVKLSILKKMQGHPEFALEVQLPETLPEGWKQDQIQEKSQTYGLGDKGSWMVQVIMHIHPDFWTREFGISAQAFWELAAQNKDWGKHILPALTEAAKLHRVPEWLDVSQSYYGALMLDFYPSEQHQKSLENWLEKNRLPDAYVLKNFAEWTPELSLKVLHVYSKQLKTINPNNHSRQYELERYLHHMALYLHPETLQETIMTLPHYPQVEHLIDLRIRMHKEI